MFSDPHLPQFVFGRLTLKPTLYHVPILVVTLIAVALGGISLLGLLTYLKFWWDLWRD